LLLMVMLASTFLMDFLSSSLKPLLMVININYKHQHNMHLYLILSPNIGIGV
jgi:hypothetical protein